MRRADKRPGKPCSVVTRLAWPAVFGLGALLAYACPAAADPQGISTNVPVQVEDAFPAVDAGEGEFQVDNRFTHDTHDDRGPDLITTSPTLKIGAAPRLQLDVSPSYGFGDQSGARSGAVSLGALYQLTDNGRWLPALAVHGIYETPYGHGHPTADYVLRAIATKYLGEGKSAPRLHLNFTWTHVVQAGGATRANQYEAGVGYSRLLTPKLALVLDALHGQTARRGGRQSYLDAGLVRAFRKGLTLSAGAGAGVQQQSAPYRIFFALQQEFGLF